MDIWQLIIKPAEIVFGIALLYFRFCLYETEEEHLQNKRKTLNLNCNTGEE